MAFSEVNRLVSERIPLDKLISKYVKLEPSSKGFKGLCPFHSEKTPSFYVNTVENFFYCFGCGASGNAITFLMQKEGYSFSDALKKLGEDFGISELVDDIPKNNELEKEKQAVLEANLAAAKIFVESLKKNEAGVKYLRNRGVSNEIQKKFGIGYAGIGDKFIEKMKLSGVDINTMLRAGLIRLDSNSKPSEFFYNRIIIPIIYKNSVIGFGGRILSGNGPKYLNSPDTIVFNKGENLFGIDLIRKGLNDFPYIVLCEGYFDVIAMHRSGLCTAVASLGTSITEFQLIILEKYNKPVVLFLDGDEAGRKAAKRIAKLKIPDKLDLRVAFIKNEGDDPDSLLMKENGVKTVKNLIENSKPLFQELIDEQIKFYNETDNLEEKIKIETKIRNIASNIPFRKQRTYNLYIQKISGNVINIRYNSENRINSQLKEAENNKFKQNNFSENNKNSQIKKVFVIGLLFSEFIPALEEIRDVIFSSNFAFVYEEVLKRYFAGEELSEILDQIDPEKEIVSDFEGKPISYIEKNFHRELAAIKFNKNNEIIKFLDSDDSSESQEKKLALILENRNLKEIIVNNEIKNF